MQILRSNIEGTKRFYLDRLTTDQQPLLDPNNIDSGPGNEYDYGGVGDSNNFGIGFDCSGLDFVAIAIALYGFEFFAGKGYYRMGTTETFPGPFQGFKKVSQADCINGNYPIKVMIGHYGGGENSHMACIIDDWHMESNGSVGICGGYNWRNDHNVTRIDSNYWNDWWVFDGTINEDTNYRTPTRYPLVLDYSAGRLTGASLKRAGVTAVCRYLYGDGTSLPNKQLHKDEADDLIANGIGIVSNFEQATDNCKGGYQQGVTDANHAVSVHNSCGGPTNAVIYFSVDYDAPESDQQVINEYFKGVASVIGLARTAAYGGYWVIKRLLDAGLISMAWQTEAWSGDNFDSRSNIIQRNKLGYKVIDGVQCDYNEAHSDNFGQWGQTIVIDNPAPIVTEPVDPFIAWYKGATDRNLLEYLVAQLGPGDPSWDSRGMTMRDAFWNSFLDPVPSISRYGDGKETPCIMQMRIDSANTAETFVERMAIFGSPDHINMVVSNAKRGDALAMVIFRKIPASYLASLGITAIDVETAFKQNYNPNFTN